MIIITGQTATGKTDLARQYCQKYNGEIVNFDSRQIYKNLDIITGKDIYGKFTSVKKSDGFDIGYYPTELKILNLKLNINSWLYDIVAPNQYFSSFDYQRIALPLIRYIVESGKTPILVGGTYFYIYHLLYHIETENIKPDWALRQNLAKKSVKDLQTILSGFINQPQAGLNNSDFQNPQRLIRKIEIARSSGLDKKPSLSFSLKDYFKNIDIDFIGIKFKNKNRLTKTITERVEKRIGQGAFDEVENLLKKGFEKNDPGLKTIGYRQIILYFEGKISKREAIELWITKEIQYAKRQLTFMKRDANIKWREI